MENRPKQQRLFQDDEDSDTDQEPLYPFTISDEDSWLRRHYLGFLNTFPFGNEGKIESPLWQVVWALVITLICSAGAVFLVGFILLVVSSEPGGRIRTETVNGILKLAATSGAVFGVGYFFFMKNKAESSKSEAEDKDED